MKGIVMKDAIALVSTSRDIVALDMKSNERQTPLPFPSEPFFAKISRSVVRCSQHPAAGQLHTPLRSARLVVL
jgi:predicted nucleic acid binding AN1-type Zn finger protein